MRRARCEEGEVRLETRRPLQRRDDGPAVARASGRRLVPLWRRRAGLRRREGEVALVERLRPDRQHPRLISGRSRDISRHLGRARAGAAPGASRSRQYFAGFFGQPSTKVRCSTRQPRGSADCCTWKTCAWEEQGAAREERAA